MKRLYFLRNTINVFNINPAEFFVAVVFLFGLYLTSFVSYDIFHSLVELFSVVVIFGMFVVAWNARNFFDNHFLLFLSIAYVFMSFIDIAHTLAYKGVGIFTFFDLTPNLATQLWIAARYIQALALLTAPFFLTRKINVKLVVGISCSIVVLIFISIFYLKIFPISYVDGVGLTPFKKISEYVISSILAISALFLYKKRKVLDEKIFYLIFASTVFTIASELSFTGYAGVFDLSNMLGHYFKVISFLLIYKTVVETGLKNPLAYIFKNLEQNAKILRTSQEELLTKKKELESLVDNLKVFQLAMDNAFAHIVVTDENGYIIFANKSAENLTGFNKKEILGERPSLWGKQMDTNFYKNFWKIIKEDKKTFSGEIINKRKNGELYQAEIRVSPVLDNENGVKFFVALERDITKEKEIDKAKTEFISMAAHQLRTPLATISLTSEMLLRNIAGGIPKENKKYLKIIIEEVRGMAEMITVFLNVSRIDIGKFPVKMEMMGLYDVIERTVKDLLPQSKDKKIHLTRDYKKDLPVLNLDRNIMKIILENLLSNAIKYSERGGEIILGAKENEDNIIIEVSDKGLGIPEKQQSKIFTKMFRAENVFHSKSEGSGLGLYLVKNLVEQSGYDISFESKENKGSTFKISIPKKTKLIDNLT